jgi:protein involved in polysaccharide export with SLBB domain
VIKERSMLSSSKAFKYGLSLCLWVAGFPLLPLADAQSTMQARASAFSSAPTGENAHTGAPSAQLLRRGAPYRLRQGDVVELNFQLCPEFNQDVTVQPDGQISVRGVAPINVEGQSLTEVTASVVHAYSTIMREPVVAVALKDFEKPFFIAAGEVTRPGKYDLRSSMTITEAVAIAGGFDKDAKHSQVVLFRPVGDDMFQSRVVDVKKLLADRDLNQDVRLLPGDVLYVPKSKMSYVRPYIPSTNVFLNPFAY